jgi:carbonic anhydrase/acetyltransferase-like protein (isoleucine patch superfamily)
MKAYMLQSNKNIEPLNEHPRDCLIINRKLSELQEEVLRASEHVIEFTPAISDINDPEEHIIFVDSLFFTRELLDEFIAKSRESNKHTICAAKPGITTLRTVTNTQDVSIYPDRIEYGLHYVPAHQQNEVPTPIIINLDQFYEAFPMPEHIFGGKDYSIPASDSLIAQIDHWTNLYAISIAVILSEGAKLRKTSKLKQLQMALKARSSNKWQVLSKLNQIGGNCDIHHTAYIEGSTIGNNVRIGAGSVIRESIIGDNSYIGNNVTSEMAVIGEECNVRNGAVVQYSVLYPGTFTMSRLISLSLCGRNTFLGDGVVLSDLRLDKKPVTVIKDGKQIDTENTFIGSCLGHGVYLGAGCVVAPGRIIPNETRITPDNYRMISKCNPDQEIDGYKKINIRS